MLVTPVATDNIVALAAGVRAALWLLAISISMPSPFLRAAESGLPASSSSRDQGEKRGFDIPAGHAVTTLQRFFAQSGTQLIYRAQSIEGVSTQAVRGTFTSQQALERMLAGTDLIVKHDENTGVLAIVARNNGSGRKADPGGKDSKKKDLTMKTKNPLALLFGWVAAITSSPGATGLATSTAQAQSSEMGIVQGNVRNAATTLYLEGARVEVVGRGLVVLTDREGRYLIKAPVGDVTLVVSYTGLDSQQIMVRVLPGQVNTHDVALSSGIYTMDALVVADVREGNALAITQQRNAPNVKNVAATDAFGNIADGNAAEMLRLLPGMAAENTESESRFMMIRGIDANLNSVTFDGMKLASGGSGSERQTGMSEIPLGTVEYMEVTKSPTPDMDGDSIGGTINMRPASVFDRTNPRRITYAFSVSGRATGSFPGAGAFTSRRIRPTASLGYSDLLGARKNIGITLNLSHTENWVPMGGMIQAVWQRPATGPDFMSGTTLFDYHSTERKRTGANLRVDYKLSENSRFFVNSFYTYYASYQGHQGGRHRVTGLAQIATLDPDGHPIPFQPQFPWGHPNYRAGGFNAAGVRVQASVIPGYSSDVTDLVNSTYQFFAAPNTAVTERYSVQPGGIHKFGTLEIDYSAMYQESPNRNGQIDGRDDAISDYLIRVLNTSWRLDGSSTGSNIRRKVIQTGGPDVRDPANWQLQGLANSVVRNQNNIYGGQLNLKRSFQAPVPYYIKSGVKWTSEERSTKNPNRSYTYAGPQGAFLESLVDSRQNTDLRGRWYAMETMPTYVAFDKLHRLKETNPEYFVLNPATALQNELQNDKKAKEDVMAAYAMGNITLGRLSVLGGLRVEKTEVSAESAVEDPQAAAGITDPVERVRAVWGRREVARGDYMNVLPGIHFKYEAGANWLVRASYSASFGRPGFGSLYPDTRINYEMERITKNNPGLKPQEADNFDLSIERYFEPVGLLSAGVFLKEINNFLYDSVSQISTGQDNGFNGEYGGWELATPANGGSARVRGVELSYSQQLSFLPGALRGLGVFANYTWLGTEGDYGRVGAPADSALVNFAPEVVNAGLNFGWRRFTSRINSNYTSNYLRTYNTNPAARSHRASRTMVDVKFGYRLTNKINLFVDASNVFNSKQVFYSKGTSTNLVTDIRDFGVRVQAGVTGRF